MKKHQIGWLKDIFWYLKGATETGGLHEIKECHIVALHMAIEELSEQEKPKEREV